MSAQRSTSAQPFGRTRLPRNGKATVPPETVEEDDSARQEQDEDEQGPAKNSAGEITNAGEDAEEQNDREGLDDQLDGTRETEDEEQELSLTERLFEELELLKMKNQRLELEMNAMRERAAERPARKGTSGEEGKGSERRSVRARVQAEKYGTALSDSEGDYMDPEDVWEGVDPYARLNEVSSTVRAAVMQDRAKAYEKASGRDPRAPEPNTFHGKSKQLPSFLVQCDTFVTLQPNTYRSEFQRVLAVISRFRDDAGVWITPYMDLSARDKPLMFQNYQLFKKAMRDQWPMDDEKENARRVLQEMKQTSTAQEYLARFALQALYSGYDDDSLISLAEGGLEHSLLIRLKNDLDAPENFDKWRQWVVRIENRQRITEAQIARSRYRPSSGPLSAFTPKTAVVVPASIPQTAYVPRRPYMSPEERERNMREGNCFSCGEKGHIVNACPKRGGKAQNLATGANAMEVKARAAYVEDCSSDSEKD